MRKFYIRWGTGGAIIAFIGGLIDGFYTLTSDLHVLLIYSISAVVIVIMMSIFYNLCYSVYDVYHRFKKFTWKFTWKQNLLRWLIVLSLFLGTSIVFLLPASLGWFLGMGITATVMKLFG